MGVLEWRVQYYVAGVLMGGQSCLSGGFSAMWQVSSWEGQACWSGGFSTMWQVSLWGAVMLEWRVQCYVAGVLMGGQSCWSGGFSAMCQVSSWGDSHA